MSFANDEANTVRSHSSAVSRANDGPGTEVKLARSFWRTVERLPVGITVSGGPDDRPRTIVVVSGWIAETRILSDGRRQIFCFLIPGDVATTSRASDIGGRALVALTNAEVADAGALGLPETGDANGNWVAEAARRSEARLYDHIVRVGRLTARERVLNLLLELHDRLDSIGLVKENTFRLPLTQEVFADALGLSVVHINRTLQQLRREGLITLGRGAVTLHHQHKLSAIAYYQPRLQRGGGDHGRRPAQSLEAPAVARGVS